MTSIKPKKTSRYCRARIVLCCLSGYSLLFIIFIYKYWFSSVCLPINPDDIIVDRQDEWQYQNSITGQWYYWRTVYRKQNNHTEWQVKWLNGAPTSKLGVIVYLARKDETNSLKKSFTQLLYLSSSSPRPVVIFHEGDFGDNNTQQNLAQALGSRIPLAFEHIQFFNSSRGPWSVRRRSASKYLDMCRFFTLMIPNHPLLSLFTYYWRLDTHSYIFGSESIKDPFEIMEKQNIQFGFVMASGEMQRFAFNLWSFFHKFLKRNCLKPSHALEQTQTGWFGQYSLAIVYTNFMIAKVSLFRDHSLIRAWLHTVDRNGGIYRYRWGDAPLHTLAVTQFIHPDQIVRFRYFGYMHRREYACAKRIKPVICKEQITPLLGDLKITYYNYRHGCWPSSKNPLCHYYREINL